MRIRKLFLIIFNQAAWQFSAMKKITIFDTYSCSGNLGDQIIMESVITQLQSIFSSFFPFFIPTHEYVGKNCYKLLKKSDFIFVGGTNLLTSKMNKYNQWRINFKDYFHIKNTILFGVGWWQYQNTPNLYTSTLLKKILHNDILHSVRDSYTQNQLKNIGLCNVINTGCPTIWNLTKDECSKIPRQKSDEVVLTFTDYKPSPKYDRLLYKTLKKNFSKIYFWVQGSGDYEYAKSIFSSSSVEILSPNLSTLDHILKTRESIEYIGTRLHAGIRALQHRRRAIIIGIDNRAKEKAVDFNLPVIMREQIDKLQNSINGVLKIDIKLPQKNIVKWKNQFKQN